LAMNWRFFATQKLFNISRGRQVPPPAHACRRPWTDLQLPETRRCVRRRWRQRSPCTRSDHPERYESPFLPRTRSIHTYPRSYMHTNTHQRNRRPVMSIFIRHKRQTQTERQICTSEIKLYKKPCCRKETARCHSYSFQFKVRRRHSLQV